MLLSRICKIYMSVMKEKGAPSSINSWVFRIIRNVEASNKFFKNYFRVITPDIPGFGKVTKQNHIATLNL